LGKGHGSDIPEAGQIWMMAMGPDTPCLWRMKNQWTIGNLQWSLGRFFNFWDWSIPGCPNAGRD